MEKKKKELISVIIPFYNQKEYFDEKENHIGLINMETNIVENVKNSLISVENITKWAYPTADIVLCDAPYGENLTSQALENIAKTGAIKNGGLVIAEMPKSKKLVLSDAFKFADKRSYGITSIHIFNWIPD